MALPLIEKVIFNEKIEIPEFREVVRENKGLGIGMFFGNVNSSIDSFKILIDIFYSSNSDPIIKAFTAIKLFDCLIELGGIIPEKHREDEKRLIRDFNGISYNLESILNGIGALKEMLSESYTKCLEFLLKRLNINDDVIEIAMAAYKYKESFRLDINLFCFSLEELEKFRNWRNEDAKEILRIINKGCEKVAEKKVSHADPLSIIVFNTFLKFLSASPLNLQDVAFVENILNNSYKNYTTKQKDRLKEAYIKICKNCGKETQMNIVQKLEDTYVSVRVHENEYNKGGGGYSFEGRKNNPKNNQERYGKRAERERPIRNNQRFDDSKDNHGEI